MKSRVLVEINCCCDCLHCEKDDSDTMICYLTKKKLTFDNQYSVGEIPDWCPLEEVKVDER